MPLVNSRIPMVNVRKLVDVAKTATILATCGNRSVSVLAFTMVPNRSFQFRTTTTTTTTTHLFSNVRSSTRSFSYNNNNNNNDGNGSKKQYRWRKSTTQSTASSSLFATKETNQNDNNNSNSNSNNNNNNNNNETKNETENVPSTTTTTNETSSHHRSLADDAHAINNVGTAVTQKINLSFKDFSLASQSILAIDPSTIEICVDDGTSSALLSSSPYDTDTSSSNAASGTSSTSTSSPPDFVDMFRGSASYIANHRNTIVVYHVPGEILEMPCFPELMDDIALTWLLGMKPVIVAGCRKQVNDKIRLRDAERKKMRRRREKRNQKRTAEDLTNNAAVEKEEQIDEEEEEGGGGESQEEKVGYQNNIRITDYDALRIVKEEAGYVRFELERQLGRALRMHQSPLQPKRRESDNDTIYNSNNRLRREPPSFQVTRTRQRSDGSSTSTWNETSSSSSSSSFSNANTNNDTPQDGNVVSGNFYSAQPFGVIDGVDFKYTGFPRRIEVEKIKRATLGSNDVVLLTNLGPSPSGEVFNVDSEGLAAIVAGALGASKLIFFTGVGVGIDGNGGIDANGASNNGQVGGVSFRQKVGAERKGRKPLQNLRVSDAKSLLRYYGVSVDPKRGLKKLPTDSDEPSPPHALSSSFSLVVQEALTKVGWGVVALESGVKRAHLVAPDDGALLRELYTRDGSGTLISGDLYEGIRQGTVRDVSGIYDLIEPLVKAGTLVPRPRTVLERDAESYFVYTRDNLIVACAQLKLFESGEETDCSGGGGFAEIGCLVVSREYRSQGRGDAMLGYLERLSLSCGCHTVFVLSTQTMEWFVERGFKKVTVESLPPSRRAVYNYERRSKIYMKNIQSERDLDTAELWWNR